MELYDMEHTVSRKGNDINSAVNYGDNYVTRTNAEAHNSSHQIKHTFGHVNCPACDQRGSVSTMPADLLFEDAADEWLNRHTAPVSQSHKHYAKYLKDTTLVSYSQYLSSLKLFFRGMRLRDIHDGNIRGYQYLRVAGEGCFRRARRPKAPIAKCPASPKKVNQEIALLIRIMRGANCWPEETSEHYIPLMEEENDVQRALEPEQQELWLHTASQRPEWEIVYLYSLLAFGTTMSSNELRFTRIGDVNLYHRNITVTGEAVKCHGRRRIIPLVTGEELWAAEKLLQRAHGCGSISPLHYLLPFRERGPNAPWNPQKPMSSSGIKSPWQEVREATGLTWFRIYDTRHTGGTRLAEAGVPIPVIKARMGHLTQKMHDHYVSISESVQRRKLEEAAANAPRFGPRSAHISQFHSRSKYA